MVKLKYTHDDETIQKVSPGLTGSDEGVGSVWDEVFYNESGAPIAAGEWVVVDAAGTTHDIGRSIKTSTTTADESCVGVALEAIADDDWGFIRRRGIIDSAQDGVTVLLASPTAGAALATDTTAGTAADATATSINKVGVCISVSAPVTVDVRC